MIYSSYGWTTLGNKDFKKKVEKTAKAIEKIRKSQEIDCVAISGSSGCAIGFPVAYLTGIPVVYVRKSKEDSHGNYIESLGHREVKRYVILDDFIDRGNTVNHIMEQINKKFSENPPKICGLVLYDECSTNRKFSFQDGTRVDITRVR